MGRVGRYPEGHHHRNLNHQSEACNSPRRDPKKMLNRKKFTFFIQTLVRVFEKYCSKPLPKQGRHRSTTAKSRTAVTARSHRTSQLEKCKNCGTLFHYNFLPVSAQHQPSAATTKILEGRCHMVTQMFNQLCRSTPLRSIWPTGWEKEGRFRHKHRFVTVRTKLQYCL